MIEALTIQTLLNKGVDLFNQYRYLEAVSAFNEVLQIEPQNHCALFGKNQALSYFHRELDRSKRDWDEMWRFRLQYEELDYMELNNLEESGTHKVVRAEGTGTFFNSPSPSNMTTDLYTRISTYWDTEGTVPNKKPYAKVGDIVSPDTILGRLAACGLFTNIVSECSGRIVRIFEENEADVEIYQPLFIIERD